jgi:hypothetical protein
MLLVVSAIFAIEYPKSSDNRREPAHIRSKASAKTRAPVYIRPKEAENLQCSEYFKPDADFTEYKKHRVTYNDPKNETDLPMDCEAIKKRTYFQTEDLYPEEREFPIAFARVLFKVRLLWRNCLEIQFWECRINPFLF